MTIEMQYGTCPEQLSYADWDYAFVGNAVDKRGQHAQKFLEEHTSRQIVAKYFPKEFLLQFDEDKFHKDDINEKIAAFANSKIIIDSITLSFAEILIISQSLKDLNCKNLSMLYIEPTGYQKNSGQDIMHKRDFELSEETIGFEAIPGHSLTLTSDVVQQVVFICGYESERIDRAMEDSEISCDNCCTIFGVPAFTMGWEMDSFDNNLSVLKERKIKGGINFCGATNPLSVIQKLELIYDGIDNESQMFVVPLGTKPMNIGACLFLLDKPKNRVAVLYDHPQEKKNKGLEMADWHLFNISFD